MCPHDLFVKMCHIKRHQATGGALLYTVYIQLSKCRLMAAIKEN